MSDIATNRLTSSEYAENFSDIAPPLSEKTAMVESERCFYCYDAPCITACPTDIDIPTFIRKINTGNPNGAARTILESNIFGGACARVCPVDTLCESVCVREKSEGKPVKIGLLQRYATDHYFKSSEPYPFKRATATHKTVAIVGAGPAGLAAAHRLAMLGHNVVVFEASTKAGGLNRTGLAAYKISNEFVQTEIDFLLKIGGISIQYQQQLGRDFDIPALQKKYDAVFLAIGLQNTNRLDIEGENLDGVLDAIDYIAKLRASTHRNDLPVGKHVIVIGGGNTAVDIASQIKRLGATTVTMLYRRGRAQLKATPHEQEIVQNDGVAIRYYAAPLRILGTANQVNAIECVETREENGKLINTATTFTLPADMVFKAIGQQLNAEILDAESYTQLRAPNGRLQIKDNYTTAINGVFAGGDCIAGGADLTVSAVQNGKKAAEQINLYLQGK